MICSRNFFLDLHARGRRWDVVGVVDAVVEDCTGAGGGVDYEFYGWKGRVKGVACGFKEGGARGGLEEGGLIGGCREGGG
jgi:hypothetical protein